MRGASQSQRETATGKIWRQIKRKYKAFDDAKEVFIFKDGKTRKQREMNSRIKGWSEKSPQRINQDYCKDWDDCKGKGRNRAQR